jgi:hypothetical protein
MARRRQHRQTESQARNDFEIPKLQQINAHCCPQKSTDITAIRQAGRRLGINHDRIETRADTSSLLNNCAPEFSIGGLHLRFGVPRWNLPGGLMRWLEHFRCRYFHRWRDVRLESAHRSQAEVDYPQAAHRAVSCASDSCGLHFNSPLGTPHTPHGSMARIYHAATAEDEG